jgi:hypothetical protein
MNRGIYFIKIYKNNGLQNCIRFNTREHSRQFWTCLNFGFKIRKRDLLPVIGASRVHRACHLCLFIDRPFAAATKRS